MSIIQDATINKARSHVFLEFFYNLPTCTQNAANSTMISVGLYLLLKCFNTYAIPFVCNIFDNA